jgi:hypothetical protein
VSVLGFSRVFAVEEMKRAAALQLAEEEFCNLCLMPRGRQKERKKERKMMIIIMHFCC